MQSLRKLAADLTSGRATSRGLVETCLERIADPKGEGSKTFIAIYDKAARVTADWVDAMRKLGASLPEWAGIPISIKDLFDVAGSITSAGSAVLADRPPANHDALAVSRLRAAGFIPIGRTNMSELAYSGIGLNALHGTPASVWDRANRRIPGGSSSGAAISITDGMAHAALGSDSGGSCRIPAAINGIVGFKPTMGRIPTDGANSMAPSLDTIGPLVLSVDCATILDAVLADIPGDPIAPPPLRGIRLGIPQPVALDRLDAPVASAFDAAVTTLSKDGASVAEVAIPELEELPAINAKGGFSAPEYYAWHRELIADRSHYYDPRILRLILRGRDMSAEEYLDLLRLRKSMIDRVRPKTDPFDAMILPTVPIVAPRIDQLDDDAEYLRVNLAILRNTRLANFLDRCAISIPCHRKGEMPVGLMLMGARGADRKLLAIAMSVEAVVSPAPS
jgi:aspartyl-tRNA(Asn)/glutamyl-tRNA(Gln) amidotransferase subunit A